MFAGFTTQFKLYMKRYLYLLGLCFCLACGSGAGEESSELMGAYQCADCVYQEIVFKGEGTALLKAQELEMPASYIVEGNKVTISIETAEYVFMQQPDGTLEGQGDVAGIYSK